jgi:sirohydrochlorin cobaltochelatase
VLEEDFLAPETGTNLLALHGTPLAADPVNIVYLGLERLVADLYPNVLAASIEGVPAPTRGWPTIRGSSTSSWRGWSAANN